MRITLASKHGELKGIEDLPVASLGILKRIRTELLALYGNDIGNLRRIVDDLGLDPSSVNFHQMTLLVCHDLLKEAQKHNKIKLKSTKF